MNYSMSSGLLEQYAPLVLAYHLLTGVGGPTHLRLLHRQPEYFGWRVLGTRCVRSQVGKHFEREKR
jgi:hypothetical protein